MKRSARRTGQCFVAAAAAVMGAALARADGLSDPTFGHNGVVNITFPPTNVASGSVQAAAPVNGRLEAVGFAPNWNDDVGPSSKPPPLYIAQLSLTGTVSSAVRVNQTAIQNPTGLAIDSAGNVFAVGVNFDANNYAHATAVWFDSAGQVVASYMRPASSVTDQSACGSATWSAVQNPLLDSHGRLVVACTYGQPFFFSSLTPAPGADSAAVLRLLPQNRSLIPDSAFGNNGLKTLPGPAGYSLPIGAAVIEDSASGTYYFRGMGSQSPLSTFFVFVARLDATTGSLDTTYGRGGYSVVPPSASLSPWPLTALTLDSSGRTILAASSLLARFNVDGTPDTTFGTNGLLMADWLGGVADVLTDSNNRIYVQGSQLYRLTTNGTRDLAFSSSSDAQTVNGFGSLWVAMQFSDSTHSSVYLLGGSGLAGGECGAPPLAPPCTSSTTGVIQKLTLSGGPPTAATITTANASLAQTSGPPGPQLLTLTATVSGNQPTGGVTFSNSCAGCVFGTASLNNGKALLAISNNPDRGPILFPGTYNITAYYGGDATNSLSSSSTIQVTVPTYVYSGSGSSSPGSPSPGDVHMSGGGAVGPIDLAVLFLLILSAAARASQRRRCVDTRTR